MKIHPRRPLYLVTVCLVVALPALVLVGIYFSEGGHVTDAPASASGEARSEDVHRYCAGCHAYPPPESLPRSAWRKEVEQGFRFGDEAGSRRDGLTIEAVVKYYEGRAPEDLPPPDLAPIGNQVALPVAFERTLYPLPSLDQRAIVTHLNLVALTRKTANELLACDTRTNRVLLLDLAAPAPKWRVLGEVPFPSHAEIVDLDGDGINDIVVASLGVFFPSDDRKGGVYWLHGRGDGTFENVPILQGIGRVADVQVGDFNQDHKIDLIVAVFGWRRTGEVILLQNRASDPREPRFEPRVVDARHGAIHVPVKDLNNDGLPDFVALFAQEHEDVVAFLNDGKGGFRQETIYEGPHPTFGCSGIQMVDLDGDGDLDVLLTNGDTLDPPFLVKPYHGVRWLENTGKYPFVEHEIGILPGVMRAVAADFDGDGDLDVVAVSYLPAVEFPQRGRLPSVVLYEQTSRGVFRPHVLESSACDHLACTAGVLPGDRLPSLFVGNGCFLNKTRKLDAVTVWRSAAPSVRPGGAKSGDK